MTLTLDRKAELLSAARLFDGVDAEGMDRIAAVAVQVDFPADHVVARQGEIGTGFFVVVDGGARVVRDGETIATLGPGRLLRRAVGPRRQAAQRPGRDDGTDDLPGPRVVGLRGGPPRGAEGHPGDPARSGRPLARPDRSVPPLTSRSAPGMTATDRPDPGTFTFLFSDIERSTQLEQRVGRDRYAAVRERHRAILRDVWAAHDGDEQGTEGDSFFVVFAEAPAAVAAAVDGQRGLAAEPWPDDAPIRVRMGLHTGGGEVTGGSFVGPRRSTRRRGSRRSPTAARSWRPHVTRDLLADQPLGGVRLRDLGEYPAQGPDAPIRILQVVADGLPAEFPPLRTPDAHPNNLPTQLTTFVGRDAELDEAARLLATTRLLTLTGPGGTGKTRLSLQLAARVSDDFPDGVFFVPLEPIRDPMLVAPRIASAIGVTETGARPIAETLADWLRDKTLLLVLDNFEQVVVGRPGRRGPAPGRARDQGRGHQPGDAAHLGRAGVPGPRPPRPARSQPAERPRADGDARRDPDGRCRDPRPVRRGPAVHRAGRRGPARVHGHQRERPGRGRDLRPAARHAAGHRARGGPDQAAVARRHPGPARAPARPAGGRVARPARSASRRCGPRSPGATTSSTTARSACSTGCRSSPAAATSRPPRPSAGRPARSAATSSTA